MRHEKVRIKTPVSGKARSRKIRHVFFLALIEQLRIVWPILSGVILAMVGSGLAIWRIEDWRLDEALYFTFVTGLKIGYGDFTPKTVAGRLLALAIGFCGIVLTGLIATVTVKAARPNDTDADPAWDQSATKGRGQEAEI